MHSVPSLQLGSTASQGAKINNTTTPHAHPASDVEDKHKDNQTFARLQLRNLPPATSPQTTRPNPPHLIHLIHPIHPIKHTKMSTKHPNLKIEDGQPSPLPNFTRHITTHNPSGAATIHSSTPASWISLREKSVGFSVAYTTSEFPANLNNDADVVANEQLMESRSLGLVNPNGTVCRVVDFAPNSPGVMHRTQSLDYGVVLEGEIEMHLDSGDVRVLKRGDIAVQRATMHEWRNVSGEWTRMLFFLQECQPVVAGGKQLGEDLNGNDDLNWKDDVNAK
ncbi:hypothetical protein P170DRAFT_441730 [Aspergillus steynii IBT 23096]|uniref:Uncharacterized protein n=1 Tax=Aspergillus steynii IBT 23096 TaxID=1392250 RepID=A0A2I2FRN5_9EURO|nr:uncharacterized protein P170DRAFT_441730 [Aspergillus steynii IBT 23096]PLB43295.1 hypothetical protein P170DRAFT_441730 [Aspergillus steynii IBT 23096]